MTTLKYSKPQLIVLANHAELTERSIEDRIAEDPSLLGLGDIVLKDRQRAQPHAGRLDILCQDRESKQRYETEIQLGKTDESHLIRTLEYWDIERKRYPQYDHAAVIIAEAITSRFLNVISLFNGFIPLIAIQMQALKLGDQDHWCLQLFLIKPYWAPWMKKRKSGKSLTALFGRNAPAKIFWK